MNVDKYIVASKTYLDSELFEIRDANGSAYYYVQLAKGRFEDMMKLAKLLNKKEGAE